MIINQQTHTRLKVIKLHIEDKFDHFACFYVFRLFPSPLKVAKHPNSLASKLSYLGYQQHADARDSSNWTTSPVSMCLGFSRVP